MPRPISPIPEAFASEKERGFWHNAQDIAFRAEKALILRGGATWLVSEHDETLVCRPQHEDTVWWETYMALKAEFPELDRLWGKKGFALTKPGEMLHREKRFPRETERVLNQHPAVQASAVFGVGDECVAFIELRPGVEFDTATLSAMLMEHCQRHIDRFKTPRRIKAMDHLPRDTAGKIDYAKLELLL